MSQSLVPNLTQRAQSRSFDLRVCVLALKPRAALNPKERAAAVAKLQTGDLSSPRYDPDHKPILIATVLIIVTIMMIRMTMIMVIIVILMMMVILVIAVQ